MRIAVCDDENIFLDTLCGEIEKHFRSLDVLCVRFGDGEDIVSAFRNGDRFDAVFLDIEMSRLDGISAAGMIREFSEDVPIIFLTSHTEFALEGYEVRAFRFLKKPFEKDKLHSALSDVEKLYRRKNTVIIKESGSEQLLSPDDIIYAESDNNDVRFITAGRVFRTRMKLSEAYGMLTGSSPCFFRIHRCIIVNLSHISGYSDKEVRTDNGSVLPMSRKLSGDFKNAIRAFIRNNAE